MSNLSERLAQRKAELNNISVRAVAARAKGDGHDLSANTVSKYLKPRHPVPARATLDALAAGFQLPPSELHALAGLPSETEPFEAHPSSDLLTPPQRTAVNEIIRLLAESNKGANHDHQGEAEPGPETRSTEHSSTSSSPDGSTPGQPGAPISELQRERDRRQQKIDAKPLDDLLGLAADKGERMDQDDD